MPPKSLKNMENRPTEPDEHLIVNRIYAAVMEQRLAPNTKLSEPKLCESFGVGRMRVRRALLLLASQGIVDLQSNKGAYVACPTPEEADEVFSARKLIETGIVQNLARASDETAISGLRNHIEKEDRAREVGERREIIRLSGEFHVQLAIAYGNTVLNKTIRELITRTSLIVGLFGTNRSATCPENEHAQILDAIVAGKPDRAAELVCHHLEHIQGGLNLQHQQPNEDDLVAILGS